MEKAGKRKLAAIMFTDIEGYTSLVAANEAQALRYVRQHRESLTKHTAAHGGEIIEFYGDGSLSIYNSAVDAVQCAIEMQKDYRNDHTIPVRIGIHLGDIVIREGSVFGNGVNVASRIESMGISGNILVSQQVANEIDNKDHISLKPMGSYQFKNVPKPVKLFAVDHPSVILPQQKQLKGGKGKRITWIQRFGWLLLTAAILLIGLLLKVFFFKNSSAPVSEVEKIAVPAFRNFTGEPSLDYIGDMAAHHITKELIKTEKANVVAFQTQKEIEELTGANDQDEANKVFANRFGVVNILDGTYSKVDADSLQFSSFIKKIKTGNVEVSFPETYFNKDNPVIGLRQLTSQVMGYWDAKDKNLVSMPTFEAYKYYMQARRFHHENDSLSRALLLKSIQSDSNFLDPYFLLTANYFNYNEFERAKAVAMKVKRHPSLKSDYEENILNIDLANLEGNNKQAFQMAMKDFQKYKRDFFTLTDYLYYTINYVNDPSATLTVFEDEAFSNLPLESCHYCRISYFLAIRANIKLKNWNQALELMNMFQKDSRNLMFYSLKIKLFSRSNQINKIDGVIQEAVESLSETQKPFLHYIAARELHNVDNISESQKHAREVLKLNSTNKIIVGWAHYFLEDLVEASSQFQKALSKTPKALSLLSQLGIIAARNGDYAAAQTYIQQIKDLKAPYQFGDVPYNLARIYLHLNQEDTALDLLQDAVDAGAKFYANNVFDQDPDLQTLVSNPRFQKIIHPLTD